MKIKKLKWDSDFFGFGIAKLSPGAVDGMQEYVRRNKIRLISSLVETNKTKNISRLERSGFEFVDLRLTFSIKPHVAEAETTRLAREEDILDLKKIARKAFARESRFNHINIEKGKVEKLYESWVEKSVEGNFDDLCFIAEERGEVAGFATYKRVGSASSSIGLIAVTSGFQGRGIGSKLISACSNLAYKERRKILTVSTEGKNITAQNFYIKNGFVIIKIESWYYKWVK